MRVRLVDRWRARQVPPLVHDAARAGGQGGECSASGPGPDFCEAPRFGHRQPRALGIRCKSVPMEPADLKVEPLPRGYRAGGWMDGA